MDTDVEVLKPIDEFLKNKAFSGFENPRAVPTGIMASEKGHSVIKELLDEYDNRHFINVDGSLNLHTNVEYITDYFVYHGLKLNNKYQIINEFALYPKEYFCPKNSRTLKIELTDNTYTIHHFAGSWTSDSIRLRAKIKKILGPNLMGIVIKIMDKIGVK